MAYQMVNSTIANLTEGKRNVTITARVMRRWKNELTEKKGAFYIDLILIDEEGTTIQATLNKSIQKKFDKGLEEGKVYNISKFRIVENNITARLTSHKCKIWFEYSTMLTAVVNNVIPKMLFKFVSFKDILDDNISPGLSVDVLGELISYHPIHDPPGGFKRTQIDLQDMGQTELSVTLWGPYVDQMIKIVDDFMSATERPILAIQFVNRTEWRENVKVSSIRGATKIYVNPEIPEVVGFKKSDCVDHESQSSRLSAVSNDSEDILAKVKIATLEEIKNTDQPGDYATLATIIEVDSNSGWFYNACNKCKKKCVKKEDGLFYCSSNRGCPNATSGLKAATPRFQVKFFATGGVDVFVEFIMFDQQIGQLIDTSAAEMVDRMEKDGDIDSIPNEFSKFIDKEMVVKLRVSRDYNLQTRRSYCYTVFKFSDDPTMILRWNEAYKSIKDKGKEKVVVNHSEGGTDVKYGATDEKSSGLELITNDTIDYLGSPTTPSSYQTPSKRDTIDIDELPETTPIPDKESRCKTGAKYKAKKIKQEK